MEIFNIGTAEFFVILVLALMILGPRRLPEYAAKAGKLVRDLRNMSQGLLIEWRRELAVATRLDELQETRRELEETQKLLRDTQQEITSETSQVTSEVSQAATEATKAVAKAPPAAELTNTTSTKSDKTPPPESEEPLPLPKPPESEEPLPDNDPSEPSPPEAKIAAEPEPPSVEEINVDKTAGDAADGPEELNRSIHPPDSVINGASSPSVSSSETVNE